MSEIKVNLLTPGGAVLEDCLIPSDYTAGQVISEVVDELELPRLSDTGEVIAYSLLHTRRGRLLPEGEQLAELGVRDGDALEVIRREEASPHEVAVRIPGGADEPGPGGEVAVRLAVRPPHRMEYMEYVLLPRDKSVGDIVGSVVAHYNLPTHDEALESITYELISTALGRLLEEEETLAQAGVPPLDRLRLQPGSRRLRVDIQTPNNVIFEGSKVPSNYTADEVIWELVDKEELPRLSDEGEVVGYWLLHVNRGEILPGDTMLSKAGVADGDMLRLLSSDTTELNLSGSNLAEWPEPLGRLQKLRSLNLSYNRLTHLPESIGLLTQLEHLDLSHNALHSLPDALLSLGSLESLFLEGNDGLALPAEILGGGGLAPPPAPGILEYYFRVRSGSRSLNEAKLILVGRGGVGKTSVVNRLVHGLFREERKTEGIQITTWHIRPRGDEHVRLNVWDFGGQEIMHATHQFFLTKRSLYLLVLNGREGGEDADAEYWLKLIESFGGDSPIIVVLNKINQHPFDVNRRALQQKYPAIRDFIKVDCEVGTGVERLRRAVERETDRLEHLRDAFPLSWFAIKERLAGMRNNYLSFDEYRAECSRLGETDPAAQETLSSYLHSLGIILNYKDDPRLKDTHVLSPHWVTNGIYKILNSEELEAQGGEIHLDDLAGILSSDSYPAQTHRFLLDLMKKFDLCFSFPGDDCHYLIPELLDKQEPASTLAFDPDECLNFQYHYTVLPEGLLPRFIVRTQVLSDDASRWRTGVILSFEGNRALVKGDAQDRKVYVSVSGPAAGRRRLLAIIRSDFERIHRDIRNLNPLEMIPLPGHPDVLIPFQELLVMEQCGLTSFKKVVGDRVIDLDVDVLLNGIDLDVSRRRGRGAGRRGCAVHLFYSYSHKDEALRNELETHLKLLQRQGLLEVWHDRRIEAGDDWRGQIDENLERAGVVLLLVSADFIASDYCFEREMRRALERQRAGEAVVLPIIVRDVNWGAAPFSGLQVLPRNGQAVTTWVDKDSAWRDVSEGIERVVKEIRRRSGP